MALGNNELNSLINEVNNFIKEKIILKNRSGELNSYLKKIGYKKEDKAHDNGVYSYKKTSKILVIGQSKIREEIILKIFEHYGISKHRIELILDYNAAEKYQYKKLQNNFKYGAILFGPIPHSTKEKGLYSSIIEKMVNERESYPEILKLANNGYLKITNNNLHDAITILISKEIIEQDL